MYHRERESSLGHIKRLFREFCDGGYAGSAGKLNGACPGHPGGTSRTRLSLNVQNVWF
jgi:hypothetical protein